MVRSILFKTKLVGNGIVNFDSKDQKWTWNKLNGNEKVFHDNVSFAKKRWYKNADGTCDRKIIISSDCLRHNVFISDFTYQSPNVFAHDGLFNRMISTPASLLRGYMFASDTTLKKKSCISISEAQQTNESVSTLDTFSRSGKKESRETTEDASDNSFFKRECIGDIEYEASGFVDLKELQFVSMSELYDRLALNPDHFEDLYRPSLEKHIGKVSERGYYSIKNSSIPLSEYGLLLTNEQIVFLVKEFFKRLLQLNITKATAFARIKEVSIKYVKDPLKDTFDSEEGWETLKTLDQVNFESEVFYQLEDENAARKEEEDLKRLLAEQKKENKDKKKAEKAEREKKKEEKNG